MIIVHVKGRKPVRFDPESDMTVEEATEDIREKYRLVAGSITTTNGIECELKLPLQNYQKEVLLFEEFQSASEEGKSSFIDLFVLLERD